MQSYESIYNKKVRYEHHSKNFDESILQDITPIELRIKNKPGINRDERSFNEPAAIGKNDIGNGKKNSNINSQVFARASYACIVKQHNRFIMLSSIPAYVPPPVLPPKIQRGSIVNGLTQGDESPLEILESLCDNNKDHSEEGRMKGPFVSDYVFHLSRKVLSQTERIMC